jgi:hypothetical protein
MKRRSHRKRRSEGGAEPVSKTKDNDQPFRDVLANVAALGALELKVGVFSGKTKQGGNKRGRKPVDGASIVAYAAANEYGTAVIPERSFLRATSDGKRDRWFALQKRLIDEMLDDKITPQGVANTLAIAMVADVKVRIGSNVPPQNAPSTARAKAGKAGGGPASRRFRKSDDPVERFAAAIQFAANASRTLVDTGTLLKSITHEVGNRG